MSNKFKRFNYIAYAGGRDNGHFFYRKRLSVAQAFHAPSHCSDTAEILMENCKASGVPVAQQVKRWPTELAVSNSRPTDC